MRAFGIETLSPVVPDLRTKDGAHAETTLLHVLEFPESLGDVVLFPLVQFVDVILGKNAQRQLFDVVALLL